MAVVLKHRVALAMTRAIRILLANRQRGRCPVAARLFIADINRFRLRIAHGIVMPRCDAVRLAVPGPRKAESALAHHGAETRVGHHVDPWRRRRRARGQISGVFATILREPAEPVKVRQFQKRQRLRRLFVNLRLRNKCRHRQRLHHRRQLLLQRSPIPAQHNSRGRHQQIAIVLRNRVPVAQEDAARTIRPRIGSMRLNLPLQLVPQRRIVSCVFLIQNNEIRLEPAQPPVSMRKEHVPHQRHIARFRNRHEHHGQIA